MNKAGFITRRFAHDALKLFGTLLVVFAGGAAHAQATYPNQPIKWIVPYPPGGATDVSARLLAREVEKTLGQTIVVDNRPGGRTSIAVQALRSAKPDGYTLMVTANDTVTIVPHLHAAPYDVENDFEFVAAFATGRPFLLVARKDFAANNAREAIDSFRKNGEMINFATHGAGSINHLRMELLMSRIGVRLNHIPYTGAAPAMQDVAGGRVDVMADSPVNAIPVAASGRIKVLAVMGKERIAEFPDVMTLEEAGVGPGAGDFSTFIGLLAPKGTQPAVVKAMSDAIERALKTDELRQGYSARSLIPRFMGPARFREHVLEDSKVMKKVITDNNITAN